MNHPITTNSVPVDGVMLDIQYLQWEGKSYKQITGATMGSLLSLVIANMYMEHFESLAIDQAEDKPLFWV